MIDYLTHFDTAFKVKLQRDPTYKDRYIGFRKIFEYLVTKNKSNYTIIETGGIRQKDNWSDGQSSVLFYDFLKRFSGKLITIDTNPSVEVNYRSWLPSLFNVKVDVITGDGAVTLSKINEPIDLLYLDSFDINHENPTPSMEHHLEEFTSAKGVIDQSEELIVAVDDNFGTYGKGTYILNWAIKNNKEILYNGYQIIFRV